MSDSVRPHRRQPTRLLCPWDSPGKITGVGCHYLFQCMEVKNESEVAQWCPTLSDPMDCSLPGSSVHGIFQERVLEWVAIAFSRDTWGTYNYKLDIKDFLMEDLTVHLRIATPAKSWLVWELCLNLEHFALTMFFFFFFFLWGNSHSHIFCGNENLGLIEGLLATSLKFFLIN